MWFQQRNGFLNCGCTRIYLSLKKQWLYPLLSVAYKYGRLVIIEKTKVVFVFFVNIQDYVKEEEILFKIRIYLQVTCHNLRLTHQQRMFLQTQLFHSLILHAHQTGSAEDTEKRQSAP